MLPDGFPDWVQCSWRLEDGCLCAGWYQRSDPRPCVADPFVGTDLEDTAWIGEVY